MASDLVLVIESGERKGERIAFASVRLTVGRNPGNDLLLKDSSVSGKHAVVIVGDAGVEVMDLGGRIDSQPLFHYLDNVIQNGTL